MVAAQRNILRNITSQETLYNGNILNLRVDHVQFPSGCNKIREVVEHKAAVTVLAVDEDGMIYLVSQYRHAVDETLYEIPAGMIEPGEDPMETASRELQEEAGCKPGKLEMISDFYSSPGYCTERIILYYATELTYSKLPEDDDEYINVHKFKPESVKSMIESGEIRDGKTILAYYWYASMMGI